MARGGYYVEADTRDFIEALRGTEHGLKDLRNAYREMSQWIERDVKAHAPVYGGPNSMATKTRPGQKDGRGSLPAGSLRASIKGGATINGPWVRAGGPAAPHAYLQEWGGKSFWSRGAGAQWHAYRSGARASGFFTTSYRGAPKGHVIYTKPRTRYGYFIWNAGYRLRHRLGQSFYRAIRDVAAKNGITVDVPAAPGLDIDPMGRD